MRINLYHVVVTDIMLYGENDSKVRIVLGDTFISTSDFPEKLENIYGNLRCVNLKTHLGNLRNVYGENAIDLDSCNLKKIDSLDEFNGKIHMINSTIDVLEHPKLKSVSLEESTVGSFGKQKHLDRIETEGAETDIKDWGELLSVNDLQLRGKLPNVTSLGKIEKANNLSIVYCRNLTTLGNLKESKTIDIHCPTLQDLGDITECDILSVDKPNIKNTTIATSSRIEDDIYFLIICPNDMFIKFIISEIANAIQNTSQKLLTDAYNIFKKNNLSPNPVIAIIVNPA